jgi:DNA repair exonuclease SbcCD ATPase subunit
MFTELCGDDALKKVILVTTMWDKVASEDASMREKELFDKPEFWGYMLSKGSTSHRHSNTEESARAIVDLLAKNNRPITTNLQRELVDEHRSLNQTSAGRELESELNKEKAKWDIERREIEEQMKVAIKQQNREAEQAMREERERYTSMIKKAEEDTGALRSDMEKLLAHRDERVTRVEQQLKEQKAAYDAAFKLIKNREKRLEKEKAKLAKKAPEPKVSPSPSPSPTDSVKSKGRGKADSEEDAAVATWTRTNEKDVQSHSRKTVYVPYWVVLHGTKFAGFSSEYNAR